MDTSSMPSTTGLRRRTTAVVTTVVLLFGLLASVAMAPTAQAATGDTFPGITISGANGSVWGDNVGASSEPGEPGFYNGATVWYQWTAPSTGLVEFNTCWAGYDSVLSVWVGDDVSSLSLITGNDDWCGLSSGIWFNTIAGTTYHLRVNGYWWTSEGSFPLNWGFHYVSEPDTDGDGQADSSDVCPNDVENDADGDGACESVDSCPTVANVDQTDTDDDGLGDACDADIDGDGVLNDDDAFPADASESADLDGDGTGDNADLDDDGDGTADVDDSFPTDPTRDGDEDDNGIKDTPAPTNKDQCKAGGWARFDNPSFRNQGQCVSSVVSAR